MSINDEPLAVEVFPSLIKRADYSKVKDERIFEI